MFDEPKWSFQKYCRYWIPIFGSHENLHFPKWSALNQVQLTFLQVLCLFQVPKLRYNFSKRILFFLVVYLNIPKGSGLSIVIGSNGFFVKSVVSSNKVNCCFNLYLGIRLFSFRPFTFTLLMDMFTLVKAFFNFLYFQVFYQVHCRLTIHT